jgi:xanthine dehydrogenase accessory factor
MDFYLKAAEFASERRAFAIATVVRVEGSSSAKPGSKALVDDRGKILEGWIGGGCAESAVRSEALRSIRTEKPLFITLNMQDEVLGVGMPCGGMVDVFIEPVVPKPGLLIAGHGRIAETLAAMASWMSFYVTVHDPAADRALFPTADRVITQDFDLAETKIDSRTFVVVATLHKNDHLWIQKALESRAGYIALVASPHRTSLVLDYLRLEGTASEDLDRIWAPAGLDLGGISPEEIALSIMSQIVLLRRGGSGGPLKLINSFAARDEKPKAGENLVKVIRQCDGGSS